LEEIKLIKEVEKLMGIELSSRLIPASKIRTYIDELIADKEQLEGSNDAAEKSKVLYIDKLIRFLERLIS